ncbi:MAG TPA: aldehyde dehydrogenase family protein [Nitrososphaerales archaeon]|nr:aldehyde dehydrogenase family protein [Nitrososphaerales archaeon]
MQKPQSPSLDLSPFFRDCFTERGEVPAFKMLIGGRWIESSSRRTIEVRSPIDGSVVALAQSGTASDSQAAAAGAHESRRRIRDMPAIDRIDVLNRARHLVEAHSEEFARTLVLEAGKPIGSARGEVRAALNRIKMTMEEARRIFGEYVPGDWSEDTMAKFALVIHEPIGVIACVTPFNYPLFSVVAKVVPALVSGNAAVVKPSSDDPISAILLAKAFQEAGVPDGVLSVVTGPGKDVGDALVANDLVGMVTLTGSTETGKHVAKLVGMKKMHLELGGKGSAIVAADADLSLAAKKVSEGSLKYSGQRCDAVSRVLVEEAAAPRFVELLLSEVKLWNLGDPRDESNTLGPLINAGAAERVQSLVDDATSKGAKLLAGGHHRGTYFEATLLDRVPLEARIAWEETFGPVITVIRTKSVDEAIEVANRSKYGLDSCVFTNSFYTAWKVAKALEEGSVSLNDAPSHGVGYFPFGGNKDSGLGREGVGYSIDEMTRLKTIQFNLAPGGLGKARDVPKL